MSVPNQKYAPANISLHIERVVLDGSGFTCAQLCQLQGSLERELVILLHAGGLPAQGRMEMATLGRLPKRPLSLAAPTPVELGRAMARGIYDALQPGVDNRP